ncbi:MAG: type II toxin-antitoxin system Phd/YefM family antitoxin [Candidatus Methanoplasma sp.]|nr:type II toxin-antitoxin system Phd/YefM family antitoxin [Candidatus Methanoplasma sp.]
MTSTDFKNNFGKYLDLSKQREVHITRHGKPEFRISGTVEERRRVIDSLDGIVKYDGDVDELLKKRLDDL